MKCWKCQKQVSESPVNIGFRATCSHCSADLHVCKNCRYYSIGKPNDCQVPGTDRVLDREQSNLCEEFKPLVELKREASPHTKKIFGEDPLPPKKGFDDLFK